MKVSVFPLGAFGTNCYIVSNEQTGRCIIIDPGDEADKVKKKIEERSLSPEAILLTHGHFDHIMAVESLREHYGVPLYMHKADIEMITDPAKSSMLTFGGRDEPLRPPEKTVNDGDTLTVAGIEVRVLFTPGHTKGSVCYIAQGCVFCGDTVFRGSIGRYDLYGGDYDELMRSVEKIKALPDEYKLYPGHGASTTVEREKINNVYFQ